MASVTLRESNIKWRHCHLPRTGKFAISRSFASSPSTTGTSWSLFDLSPHSTSVRTLGTSGTQLLDIILLYLRPVADCRRWYPLSGCSAAAYISWHSICVNVCLSAITTAGSALPGAATFLWASVSTSGNSQDLCWRLCSTGASRGTGSARRCEVKEKRCLTPFLLNPVLIRHLCFRHLQAATWNL